jgi:hypothetical protein
MDAVVRAARASFIVRGRVTACVPAGWSGLAIALRLGPHCRAASSLAAVRAPQALHDISKDRVPPGEGLGLRRARVSAIALEEQHVLTEVIGQLHDGEWRARRHHPVIVASVGCGRPSSGKAPPTLYEAL